MQMQMQMRQGKVQEQTTCVLFWGASLFIRPHRRNETKRSGFPRVQVKVQTKTVGGLGRVVVKMVNTHGGMG